MNKTKLLEKILAQLASELELYYKAAKASHQEATDEQNKAENKDDTRGLEAAYLAGGQARLAAEIELTVKELRKLVMAKKLLAPMSPSISPPSLNSKVLRISIITLSHLAAAALR